MKCEVRSVKCEVRSAKCEVRSVIEIALQLTLWSQAVEGYIVQKYWYLSKKHRGENVLKAA